MSDPSRAVGLEAAMTMSAHAIECCRRLVQLSSHAVL